MCVCTLQASVYERVGDECRRSILCVSMASWCVFAPVLSVLRAGRIQAACAEGYLCASGSAEFTPRGLQADWSQCEWGEQCAGPCPPGEPKLPPTHPLDD